MPTEKTVNDTVIGATLNQTGSFLMRAEKVGADTLLSQIVHMVSEAQRSRAPIQKLADTVAGYFVPTVILTAVLTFIVWAVWGPVRHGLCHRERSIRLNYCLSVRAGVSHADVHYGWCRQGRSERHFD